MRISANIVGLFADSKFKIQNYKIILKALGFKKLNFNFEFSNFQF